MISNASANARPYELMGSQIAEGMECIDPIARYNAVIDVYNLEQHRVRNIELHRMKEMRLIRLLDWRLRSNRLVVAVD
jgi:hypothetical protein